MTVSTADAASAPPGPSPGGHPQRWLILAVICLAQLTVLLDNTILNVAVPSLSREMDATTAEIQWMISAYSLVQSGLLLTAGNAADRYGRNEDAGRGARPVRGRARCSRRWRRGPASSAPPARAWGSAER
ncbi:hypothetical protein SANTM175S_01773 [Streptomyces antimycoticus]